MGTFIIWVTTLTFLGVSFELNLYLQPFSRYLHPNISGSRPWLF